MTVAKSTARLTGSDSVCAVIREAIDIGGAVSDLDEETMEAWIYGDERTVDEIVRKIRTRLHRQVSIERREQTASRATIRFAHLAGRYSC